MNLQARIERYSTISSQLALLSDARLSESLQSEAVLRHDWTGSNQTLLIGNQKIFVKKIKLTDLEMLTGNYQSTANYFDLPLFYQYGIGSTGFGAWRELASHVMATNWVLSVACPNFPMLYHWRMLPTSNSMPSPTSQEEIDTQVESWGGSDRIRNRLSAINNASHEIVLFLEHLPHHLSDWLNAIVATAAPNLEATFERVEKELIQIVSFMQSNGFLHFDAHFQNILTDGHQLYFSDFGLAISKEFELSSDESAFFELHCDYDFATVLTLLFKHAPKASRCAEYTKPIAELILQFRQHLQNNPQTAKYPKKEIRSELMLPKFGKKSPE